MGDSIIHRAQDIKDSNSLLIGLIIYAVAATLAIAIIIRNKKNTKHRYISWKRDKINLVVWSREYESKPDDFIEQLWDENEKRGREIIILKEEANVLRKDSRFWPSLLMLALSSGFLAGFIWSAIKNSPKTTNENKN